MTSPQAVQPVEEALGLLFPEPEEAFLNRLETILLARAVEPPAVASTGIRPRLLQALLRHRWALVSACLVLALAMALGLVGPQRVLAGFRQLVGYITGVGFVDTSGSLVLASPVVDARESITMHVEQVLAQPDRTVIVLSFEGLLPEDQQPYIYNSYLRLPDGEIVGPGPHYGYMVDWDHTVLEFPQLPDGVRGFSLVWTDKFNLRMVYDGDQGRWAETSDAWSVPIQLVPADDAGLASLGETYSLEGAIDEHFDIRLQVTEVAQFSDRTSVQVVLEWPDPLSKGGGMIFTSNEKLTDNRGRSYQQKPIVHWDDQGQPISTATLQPPGQRRQWTKWTYMFGPGALDAQSLTFSANMTYRLFPSDIGFQLELSPAIRIGDTWPLDIELDIDGQLVHLTGAKLVEVMGSERKVIALALIVDPLPAREDRLMMSIGFKAPSAPFASGYVDLIPSPTTGTSPAIVPLALAGQAHPTGTLDISVDYVEFQFAEVWQITWDTPASSSAE